MRFLRRLGQTLGMAVLTLFVVAIYLWPAMVRLGIDADLNGYAIEIRRSPVTLEEKERLLDLIEGLQDRLERGERVGLVSWSKRRQAIGAMLSDGISDDDIPLIERELKRTAKDFQEPKP